jgi:transcriptional regulator with GAF, ATPase, and Fis domain
VDLYGTLFDLSKVMLAATDPDAAAAALLRRVVEVTGAERGFIVVRDDDQDFRESSDVRFDRDTLSSAHRRFSRTLVREAIENGRTVHSADLSSDPRYRAVDSVQRLGPRAVVVSPLRDGETVYGVLYLEGPPSDAGFEGTTVELLGQLAEAAGLFLRRALERERLQEQAELLQDGLVARARFPGIVTRDPGLLGVLRLVSRVAESDARVLVLGETGTGKELVARSLHANSRRRTRPFVALNCAALPAGLLESELFGHVRGAFTGADRDRRGRIASAEGGTLFLDEVGELAPDLQARLLRVLETGELQRVGSDAVEKVDVRVVSATHRDLRKLVDEGRFRQDLYFRLRVVEVRVPALRERRSDVPLLVAHFLQQHGPGLTVTAEAMRVLSAWSWPGNVRELGHAMERACLMACEGMIGLEALPPEIGGVSVEGAEAEAGGLQAARRAAVLHVEKEFVAELLARCGGNVSQASRESGLRRSYLQKLIARHGLRVPRSSLS